MVGTGISCKEELVFFFFLCVKYLLFLGSGYKTKEKQPLCPEEFSGLSAEIAGCWALSGALTWSSLMEFCCFNHKKMFHTLQEPFGKGHFLEAKRKGSSGTEATLPH
jgi:hypothetical protein